MEIKRRGFWHLSASLCAWCRNTAIVYTLLHVGLRIAELVNLDVSDLTLRERSGSIRVLGKGNKERIVPLSAEARHRIRR